MGLNHFILNGNETVAPCAKCGEDTRVRHGRTTDTGSPIHNIECKNCGHEIVYVGYYCPQCHKGSVNKECYTDSQGRAWYIMEREDKSISIYYTHPDQPGHNVVYDSL